MMNCLRNEKDEELEDHIIEDVRNLLTLKKETDETEETRNIAIEDIRNPFRL